MPPRLAVIISQASIRDHRAAEIEEAIVAELMMTPGLDANLVGPLERIQPDSTDLLCLTGFTQEIALLSWLSLDEAQKTWHKLQLSGTLVAYSGPNQDPSAQARLSIQGRRIAYLQLSADSKPSEYSRLLKARFQDMQVKTVSLLPVKPMVEKVAPTAMASPGAVRTANVPPPPSAYSIPLTPAIFPPVQVTSADQAFDGVADLEEWRELDQLVDDLDALDL